MEHGSCVLQATDTKIQGKQSVIWQFYSCFTSNTCDTKLYVSLIELLLPRLSPLLTIFHFPFIVNLMG